MRVMWLGDIAHIPGHSLWNSQISFDAIFCFRRRRRVFQLGIGQ